MNLEVDCDPLYARNMDFAKALGIIASGLEDAEAPWAVIGGLALAVHGAGRLTRDLDIVTQYSVQDLLVSYLEALGYQTLHRSRGYSNHVHSDAEMGRIDVVYVEGETARTLFTEADRREILPGFEALVPRPEHLVAMKVLAAKNDPTRRRTATGAEYYP
jgi:hypothetical protein